MPTKVCLYLPDGRAEHAAELKAMVRGLPKDLFSVSVRSRLPSGEVSLKEDGKVDKTGPLLRVGDAMPLYARTPRSIKSEITLLMSWKNPGSSAHWLEQE